MLMELSDVRAEKYGWDLALGCPGGTWQAKSVTCCKQKPVWNELRSKWAEERNRSKWVIQLLLQSLLCNLINVKIECLQV